MQGDDVVRSDTFPCDLSSAGAARRFVREALTEVALDDWLDDAQLLVSELVTNAVLHAHTEVEVTLRASGEGLWLEVSDANPAVPLPRGYDEQATTGRGLALVAGVADDFGVRHEGDGRKTVWVCLRAGRQRAHDGEDLFAAWDLEDLVLGAGEPAPAGHEVFLQALPPLLWLAARQHHDAMLRELVLYLAEHPGTEVDFAGADQARRMVGDAVVEAVERARRAGEAPAELPAGHRSTLPWAPAALDLRLHLPARIAAAFAAFQHALDTGEALARSGRLLISPGLPEIVAVRRWASDQIVSQLDGAAPAPWPGTAQERFETMVNERADAAVDPWDIDHVANAASGAIAADEANRIVAVSPSLADLLGWEASDLVGRRLVTIIPPALREAHIAGFTRHVSTGESHVLGVPLAMPALHADGHEIPCRILIERAPAATGRSLYVAWIDRAE